MRAGPSPAARRRWTQLKDRGARLVVCTNKLTGLSTALLEALDLSRRFEAVIGADAVPAIKPDARHLQAAVDAVGGDIGRTILVGDAATDAGAARDAGAHLILVSFGYTETPAAELDARHPDRPLRPAPRRLRPPPGRLRRATRSAIAAALPCSGCVAQRESTSFTPRGSQVQSLSHPPFFLR